MSIEAIKYAARQISKHLEMLEDESYKKARVDNFIDWHKLVTKRIAEKTIGSEPKNIFYSATVPPLPIKELLPKGYRCELCEEWAYTPVKMEYQIVIEKIGDQLNGDKLTLENVLAHFNSLKIFRSYITTDTINKWYNPDPEIKKLLRPIPKLLKRYTANVIIVDNKTSYEDILIQLIVLALKDKFIEMDEGAVALFRSYIKKKIGLTKCSKQFIKDLLYPQKDVPTKSLISAGIILYHLVRNYIRPYNTYTFKFYLKKIIQGLHKAEKRKEVTIVPMEFKTTQPKSPRENMPIDEDRTTITEEDETTQLESSSEDRSLDGEPADMSRFQNGLIETINNFQIFHDKQGKRIGIGIDRAAMEFATSRDKIYRLIRKGLIKVRKIDGTYVVDAIAGKKLQEVLQEKYSYQKHVLDLSLERDIKTNSARKRIRRKKSKIPLSRN